MNILYIGSSGALSLIPFKKILSSEYSITAVGVFNPILLNDKIIALENESLSLAANQNAIQIIDLSQSIDNIIQQCRACAIELILMSCYSKRLPSQIIRFPTLGCYNLHPSLLPYYRGPEPIFWQMKDAAEMGVTWHHVVNDFDAGDICKQKKVLLDEGTSYNEINQQLAEAGAELMLDVLFECSSETQVSMAQNSKLASYHHYPQQTDFSLDTRWTAQHAYNFICASRAFGHPYHCRVDGRSYNLLETIDYDNNTSLECVETQGDMLYIPFKEGVLIARYTDNIEP